MTSDEQDQMWRDAAYQRAKRDAEIKLLLGRLHSLTDEMKSVERKIENLLDEKAKDI